MSDKTNKIISGIIIVSIYGTVASSIDIFLRENKRYNDSLKRTTDLALIMCQQISHMDFKNIPEQKEGDDQIIMLLHQIIGNIQRWRPYIPDALLNNNSTNEPINEKELTRYNTNVSDKLSTTDSTSSFKAKVPKIDLGIHSGRANILLINIHNFLNLCNQNDVLNPTAVTYQNKLFEDFHKIIRSHQGRILYFNMGEIMAFWLGVSSTKAAECALDIRNFDKSDSPLPDKVKISQALVNDVFYYGNVGSTSTHSFTISGPGIESCRNLIKLSSHYSMYSILTSDTVQKSCQYHFKFQPIDVIRINSTKSLIGNYIYELCSNYQQQNNEWMYQIKEDNDNTFSNYAAGRYSDIINTNQPQTLQFIRIKQLCMDAQRNNCKIPNKVMISSLQWEGTTGPIKLDINVTET
eukprot:NODE_1785_length_1811_cov_32.643365_g1515_i0.p1 GENE.NODE_1785_length_1811_cov_32.643365_g1515_i0~~NODE_1785_length_1811_cov_32.643365_g1515_i0.p1  ORF type:complete len:460 (-),score=51.98 NODE_1785_length_1811_cov_32.643365_g1515_i0:432-1655(-)